MKALLVGTAVASLLGVLPSVASAHRHSSFYFGVGISDRGSNYGFDYDQGYRGSDYACEDAPRYYYAPRSDYGYCAPPPVYYSAPVYSPPPEYYAPPVYSAPAPTYYYSAPQPDYCAPRTYYSAPRCGYYYRTYSYYGR